MTARLALALLLLAAPLAAPARAGDDMAAVNAVWADFTAALRRGDYRRAYAMFTPQSRAASPYHHFLREYGPLSLARRMVVTPPASLSTEVDGDWAEIAFAGDGPGGRFRVGASLARNNGAWGLVMATNDAAERLEARVRNLLATAARWQGDPDAAGRLEGLARQAADKTPGLNRYRFEIAGGVMRAMPAGPGLRSFHVDGWGAVREGAEPGRQTPPPEYVPPEARARPAPPPPPDRPPPAQPPRLVNGLPELREPPPPGGMAPGSAAAEAALPPLPPPPPNRYQPERLALPEVIGGQ